MILPEPIIPIISAPPQYIYDHDRGEWIPYDPRNPRGLTTSPYEFGPAPDPVPGGGSGGATGDQLPPGCTCTHFITVVPPEPDYWSPGNPPPPPRTKKRKVCDKITCKGTSPLGSGCFFLQVIDEWIHRNCACQRDWQGEPIQGSCKVPPTDFAPPTNPVAPPGVKCGWPPGGGDDRYGFRRRTYNWIRCGHSGNPNYPMWPNGQVVPQTAAQSTSSSVDFMPDNSNVDPQYVSVNTICLFEGNSGDSAGNANGNSSPGGDLTGSLAAAVPIPSLIHQLFQTNSFTFNDQDIENTRNGIWLKSNSYSWPFKKPIHQLKFIELLAYITQNSVRKLGNDGIIDARFFLWSDIDGKWYFKSLGKLIEDHTEEEEEVFYVNPESEHLSNKIYNIRTISSNNDAIKNIENNIFYSSYLRIDPNYKDPYIDFIDTHSSKILEENKLHLKYEYDKEFNKVKHIEVLPLASSYVIQGSSGASGGTIHSTIYNTDNTKYGYFNETRYNTPNSVWWETIGTYGLDTDHTSKWQTQYDITETKFEIFHEIYTRVKVPLIKNRKKFNILMNLKRKWEAYRCVVCCLSQPIGSSKDEIMFQEALLNPSGITFNKIYGEDGVFSNTGILKRNEKNENEDKYGIVAAGSFTDLINYGVSGITGISADANGLYVSRDLSKDPYKQTIGQFYNLSTNDKFVDSIIDKAKTEYETTLLNNKKRMNEIYTFLSKVDDWIIAGISFINENTVACEQCNESVNRESILKTVNNYWSLVTSFKNNNIVNYFKAAFGFMPPTTSEPNCGTTFSDGVYSKGIPCGFKEIYAGPNIPITYSAGSSGKTYFGPYLKIEGISAKIPYIELGPTCCLRTINFGNTYGGGEKLTAVVGPVEKNSYIPKFQYLPVWCMECSSNIFVRGKDNLFFQGIPGLSGPGSTFSSSVDYFNQQSPWGISERHGAIPCGLSFGVLTEELRNLKVSYNEYCFNPNVLIALKHRAKSEYNALNVETYILTKLFELNVINGARKSIKQQNKEWRDRPSFFYSKTPGSSIFYKGNTGGGIQTDNDFENVGETSTRYRKKLLKQPLSLQGIKSITRKDIRGSRYEILAKSQGVSGDSLGIWLYNIAFGDNNPGPGNDGVDKGINDTGCPNDPPSTLHPYYDQRCIGGNHNTTGAVGASGAYFNNNKLLEITKHYIGITYAGISGDYLVNIPMMLIIPGASGDSEASGVSGAFDIKTTSIPSNLKRESIASYVRIEFSNPIGLDRIGDFPSGFVRSAGCEYFLPYLVSLTVGPTGRQTIRNNVAVIGMDPHGFDVAVKKMKVESRYDSKNNWWWEGGNPEVTQTDLTRNGMDLWPEFMFETEFPYYTSNPYESENLITDDEKWSKKEHHWQRSAEFDPERRKTAMGSGWLMSSHRKIKPHRSWWSCYIPQNLFIPQKLYSMINELKTNTNDEICEFYRRGYIHTKTINGDDFDGWLTFAPISEYTAQEQTEVNDRLLNTTFGIIT